MPLAGQQLHWPLASLGQQVCVLRAAVHAHELDNQPVLAEAVSREPTRRGHVERLIGPVPLVRVILPGPGARNDVVHTLEPMASPTSAARDRQIYEQ